MAKKICYVAKIDLDSIVDGVGELAIIKGCSEEDVLGISGSNAPDYVSAFVDLQQQLVSYLMIDEDELNGFDFANFSVLLDVLLRDTINDNLVNKDYVLVPDNGLDSNIFYKGTVKRCEHSLKGYYQSIVGYVEGYDSVMDTPEESKQKEEPAEDTKEKVSEEEDNKEEEPNNDDSDKEIQDEWGDIINEYVNSITAVYKVLYESAFFMRPYGAMYEKGFLKYHGASRERSLESLFEVLNTGSGGTFNIPQSYMQSYKNNKSSIMKPSIKLIKSGMRYFPHYHLNLMSGYNGKCKSYSEFEYETKKRLIRMYIDEIKNSGLDIHNTATIKMKEYLAPLMPVLMSVLSVAEFIKGSSMLIKGYAPNFNLTKQQLDSMIANSQILNLKSEITLLNIDPVTGVFVLSIVLDKTNSGNPIFAYEALDMLKESGAEISWRNVFLGRLRDNTPFFHDFTKGFSNTIVAGSGSGKGVMTLNILASAYGSGYPVFYLDCKPEMSATLVKIAKSGGFDTFAFDAINNIRRGYIDTTTDYNEHMPSMYKEVISKDTFTNVMSYLRGIELICLIAKLRGDLSRGENVGFTKEELGGERIVAVFDEFEAFSLNLVNLCNALDGAYKSATSGLSAKEKEKYKEEKLYINKFNMYVNSVTSAVSEGFMATFRVADVSLFFIFQHTDTNTAGDKSMIAKLSNNFKTSSFKLMGRGTDTGTGSEVFGTSKLSQESKKLVNDRYFSISRSAGGKVDEENCDVFKPYLVLNENTEAFVGRLEGVTPEFKEEKLHIKEVGFEGYAESLLGVDIKPLLQKSYTIAENVVTKLSLGDSLMGFMYDIHNLQGMKARIDGVTEEQFNNEAEKYEFEEDADGSSSENYDFEQEPEGSDTASVNNTNEIPNPSQQPLNTGNTSEQQNINNNPLQSPLDVDTSSQTPVSEQPLNQEQGVFNTPEGVVTPVSYEDYIFKNGMVGINEESFMDTGSTVDSLYLLTEVLHEHIDNCIGDSRVSSIIVKDRYVIVNNVKIAPRITEDIVKKLPYDVQASVLSGRYADLFCFGVTRYYPYLKTLTVDDMEFFTYKVLADYDLPARTFEEFKDSMLKLFKINKNLHTVTVGNEKFTVDSLTKQKTVSENVRDTCRARSIDNTVRNALPDVASKDKGIVGFYRNPSVSTGTKVLTTAGAGALAFLVLSNPIGVVATSAVVGKKAFDGAKSVFGKVKSGFKAFSDAFKESL